MYPCTTTLYNNMLIYSALSRPYYGIPEVRCLSQDANHILNKSHGIYLTSITLNMSRSAMNEPYQMSHINQAKEFLLSPRKAKPHDQTIQFSSKMQERTSFSELCTKPASPKGKIKWASVAQEHNLKKSDSPPKDLSSIKRVIQI